MRQVDLETVRPGNKSLEEWIGEQFTKINEASQEDAATAAADAIDFNFASVTETLTGDPASASTTTVRNLLFTLIMFIKKRGPQKSQ